ncbi:MAG: hypothetical protein KDA61_06165, partial [Planctomycetales bacterium]|nr:hypothetical protein [Planctomycetales bacterium]
AMERSRHEAAQRSGKLRCSPLRAMAIAARGSRLDGLSFLRSFLAEASCDPKSRRVSMPTGIHPEF